MSGSVPIKQGSETDLLSAVANVGPIAVAVDGSSNAFRVSRHMHVCKLGYLYVSVQVYASIVSNNNITSIDTCGYLTSR